MGVWADHHWNSAKALNGFLSAILLPVPFIYLVHAWGVECSASNAAVWWQCTPGVDFIALAAIALYLPMYVLAFTVHSNGWLNDLYWTVIPVLALYQHTHNAFRLHVLHELRAGMLWGVILIWAARLTHNYLRREDYTYGAQEDFRYRTMRVKFGALWFLVSPFAQFVSQLIPEGLFTIPYVSIVSDPSRLNWIDYVCVLGALICVIVAGIADNELREFINDPNHRPDSVLSTGIWSYSRHPNYVAESSFHWFVALWGVRHGGWIVVIGALVNTLVLIVTTYLTETHMRSGRRQKAFEEYRKKTPCWILV